MTLHHQVGHAFRKAKGSAGRMPCWSSGLALAGHMSRWTVTLDAQLAAAETAGQEKAGDKSESRVLSVHLSDATDVPYDGDAVSIASTAPWEHRSHSARKPRHRPSRRARRRERQAECEHLTRLQHLGNLADLEIDLGRFPLDFSGTLAACLEEDAEDALSFGVPTLCSERDSSDSYVQRLDNDSTCDNNVENDKDIDEDRNNDNTFCPREDDDDCTHSDDAAAHRSCSHIVDTGSSSNGRNLKRKLDTVDFCVQDRDDLDERLLPLSQEAGPASISGLSEMQAQSIERDNPAGDLSASAHTLDEYYMPIEHTLRELQAVLSGGAPNDDGGIILLRQSILAQCDKLKDLIRVRPRHGLIKVSHVIDLIQAEITERDTPGQHEYATSPGLYKWCGNMEECIAEYDRLENEDQELALADVYEEMQMHVGTIDYCLEALEELQLEERENERENESIVQRMLQQRLAASLSSKR